MRVQGLNGATSSKEIRKHIVKYANAICRLKELLVCNPPVTVHTVCEVTTLYDMEGKIHRPHSEVQAKIK